MDIYEIPIHMVLRDRVYIHLSHCYINVHYHHMKQHYYIYQALFTSIVIKQYTGIWCCLLNVGDACSYSWL